MHLIPKPKKIKTESTFVPYSCVNLVTESLDSRIINAASKLPTSKDGAPLYINIEQEIGDGYKLTVDEEKITVNSEGLSGAFYAVQTLRQIFKNEHIPCMHIEDNPDYEYRGFYHDVTRGRVPTVDTIKKLIDAMAYYKLNSLQLYVEHTFEFEECKDSIEKTGYLTAEELKELDSYCHENFIDFIPSLATFGHMYEILEKDRFKHLRVIKDFEPKQHFWISRMRHHTIDPKNPESFELVKSLIDQYAPHFTTEYFNICCDETFDLKTCHEERAGDLYIGFVQKIIDHLTKKGNKIMMWADILLQHPETINQLPDGTIFLNWDYKSEPTESNIERIAQSGKKQIVCPGTTTWNRICENVEVEEQNISKMAEYGKKYGAVGLLNTNWGDYGNLCSMDLGMYGMVLGAEKAWSVYTEINDDFYSHVNHLLYENENAMQCLKTLSELHKNVTFYNFVRYYSNINFEEQETVKLIPDEEMVRNTCEDCKSFISQLSQQKWSNDDYRREMILAAEGIHIMAELFAKCEKYPIERQTDTKAWLAKYRQKWLENNKESELCEIEKIFMDYENMV